MIIPQTTNQRQKIKYNLNYLIDQAARLAMVDPRHIAILEALKRLAEQRCFGPRFGLGSYKPKGPLG